MKGIFLRRITVSKKRILLFSIMVFILSINVSQLFSIKITNPGDLKKILKTNPDPVKIVPLTDSLKGSKSDVSNEDQDTEKKVVNPDSLYLRIDRKKLSPSFFTKLDNLNVKDIEIKDLLRGISQQNKVNIIIDNEVTQLVTLSLTDINVLDLILYLCESYKLAITQRETMLRIYPRPVDIDLSSLKVSYKKNLLSLDLSNADLAQVVKAVATKTGKNILIKSGVSGRITGMLNAVPWETGFRSLLTTNGFSLSSRNGVYNVSRRGDTGANDSRASDDNCQVNVNNGKINLEIRDINIVDVIRELTDQTGISIIVYGYPETKVSIKCSNLTLDEVLSYILKGTNFTYRKDENIYVIGDKKVSGLLTTKLFKLNHIKVDGILELMPESIKKNSTLQIIKEQNGLVAITTNDILNELEDFLKQIDSPTPQILIEALVVDFNITDTKELGVKMASQKDTPDSVAWNNYSMLDMGFNQQGKFYTQQNGISLNKGLNQISDMVGWKNIGKLPDNFYLQIQALASQGKADIKSRPQISTLNGHPASISIGTTQYYILKSTTPVRSENDVITQETERFEKIDANVKLSITPWVSASGEITAEIKPEFLTPVGSFNSKTPPTINSRVLDATVRLKDGETIILGGLIEERESNDISKIPFLGDLPFIGKIFTSSRKSKTKSELMIYITPYVFYGDERDTNKWELLKSKYKTTK